MSRVYLFPNDIGAISINDHDIGEYFSLEILKMVVRHPLDTTDDLDRCPAPRDRPRPAEDGPRVPPYSEGCRIPHPRPSHEGAQEV